MESPFKEGQRVKLRRDVERFPFFIAKAGMVGTVSEAQPSLLLVRMDEQLAGCEEWDNEIAWQDLELPTIEGDLELLDESGEYITHLRSLDALAFLSEAGRVAAIPEASAQRHAVEVVQQERIAAEILGLREALFLAEIEVVKGPVYARRFIEAAARYLGPGFHNDTPFGDYVDRSGSPTFSASEARLLDDGMEIAMDTLREQEPDADPYEIAMAVMPR